MREVFSQISARQGKKELVETADRISAIDKVEIYDKGWFKKLAATTHHKDEQKTKDEFKYEKVAKLEDLPQLKKKLPGFFGDESEEMAGNTNGMEDDDSDVVPTDGEEYLDTENVRNRNKRTNTFGDLGKMGGAGLGAVGSMGKGLGGGLTAGLGAGLGAFGL